MLKKVSGKKMNNQKMEKLNGGQGGPVKHAEEPDLKCLEFCGKRCGVKNDSLANQASGQTTYQS